MDTVTEVMELVGEGRRAKTHEFFKDAIHSETDDCIIWPYSRIVRNESRVEG